MEILNDWAANCKGVLRLDGYTNSIPDPNEYLLCIQAYQFANAAELLRDYTGWAADDFTAFKSWMRETFGKLAYEFLESHTAISAYGEAEGTSTDELGFGTLMFGEAVATTYTLTVSEAGAATLVLPFSSALPAGVKAYTLSYTSGSDKVTATAVEAITANQPVLINAEAGDYTFTSTGTNTNTPQFGALTGVYATTVVPNTSYILTSKNGQLGFRKADGATNTVAANHAYLTADATAPLLYVDFGGTTGISVLEKEQTANGCWYNLNGQRVAQPAKGLYIVNGRKVIK